MALAGALLGMLALAALLPLTLVLRYRAGTARRQARGWLATLNAAAIGLSACFLLFGAAITSFWLPRTLTHTLLGLAGGFLLGLVGLWWSRWEAGPGALHYTPNRWLVLALTLVVTGRIVYGVWRAWDAWRSTAGDGSWLAASGAAGSFAAGAVVLGYYFTYWAGIRRRSRRFRARIAADAAAAGNPHGSPP